MERGFIGLDVAVLAVSEATAIADEAPAQLVLERLGMAGHRIVARERIDDSVQLIKAKYLEWIADERIDVVIVTSGAKSEAASEALTPLVTKRVDGFSDLFRFLTFSEIGTAAMLVDAAAGQCKQTFFFVLPASIGAVRTALDKLLLPQLDYRTKPHNLVMRMPRHHLGASEAEAATPSKTPWIVPKDPSAPVVIAPRTVTKRAGTEPGTPAALASSSVSQRIALAAIDRPEPVRVSQRMSAVIEAASAPTVPAPRHRPPTPPLPVVRTKVMTAKDNVPLKPPAQIIPLSQLLTNAPSVEELADYDDGADVPVPPPEEVPVPVALRTKVPTGPIRIEDESTREAIVAAQKRAVTERVAPLDELPPRSVAIPARRKRDKMVVALWAVIAVAAASLVVMMVIARQRDRRAQAMREQQAADTRVADLTPPTPTAPSTPTPPAPTEPVAVPPELDAAIEPVTPTAEPGEIDMTADVAMRVAANPVRPLRPPTTPQPRPPRTDPVEKLPVEKPVEKLPVEKAEPVEAGCDEVSCVLDRYRLSCCAKFKPAEQAPPVHSGTPEKLDRSMVTAGISKVKPAVIRCGESAGVTGKVKVNVTVSPAGAVTDVSVAETPDAALGTCVANAVRKATFETTETGGSFGYPFVF